MATPRTSRSVSGAPSSAATIEKRRNNGVRLPLFRKAALVHGVTSAVTSKWPKAPPPLTWYTRSGMRSRTKWASFSFRYLSCSRLGPPGPTVSEYSSLGAGMPASVVVIGLCCLRWSLIYSSNRDLFLTVTLVVRRKCCRLHVHALTAVIMNVFNKRRWERMHTRSLSAHMQNRSDQSSQPTLPLLVALVPPYFFGPQFSNSRALFHQIRK